VIELAAAAILPSLVVAWAAGFWLRRQAPRWGLLDRPGGRKLHGRAMPTGGGIAIWLGIVVPLAIGQGLLWLPETALSAEIIPALLRPQRDGLAEQAAQLWAILGGGTGLMVLGLIDDRRGLDWRLRLAVQTLVAVATVAAGWRLSLFLDVPALTTTLSVVWIVGLVNSFNMLDNMDGLSAGVAAIAAMMLAAVMLLAPDPLTLQPQLFVAVFLLVLAGSLIGFLWHNHQPARIYMGDAGSYLVGYLIALGTLLSTYAGGNLPRHAILAPLCVLAVPIYDTVSVVTIRLRQGRSPFVGDRSHFSHRLVELGLTPRHTVWTIYLLSTSCGLGALVLHQVDSFGALLVAALIACVLTVIAVLETAAARQVSAASQPTGKSADIEDPR